MTIQWNYSYFFRRILSHYYWNISVITAPKTFRSFHHTILGLIIGDIPLRFRYIELTFFKFFIHNNTLSFDIFFITILQCLNYWYITIFNAYKSFLHIKRQYIVSLHTIRLRNYLAKMSQNLEHNIILMFLCYS